MRTADNIIVTAIDLYYEGLSIRKAQRQLMKIFKVNVTQMTVWNWVQKYANLVHDYVITLKAENLGGEFHADETVIQCKGNQKWFWEMMDKETKYMVASHVSETRTKGDAATFFKQAQKRSATRPSKITVDGLRQYDSAFNKVFYSRYKAHRVNFVQFVDGYHNTPVERLHNTLKDRTKVTRGLGKGMTSVENLLAGWDAHYNFIRPHMSLDGKTPAQAAGVPTNLNDGWGDLITLATYHKTATENQNSLLNHQH